MIRIETVDEAGTAALGARLAACLKPGDAVLLSGPVGAGKSVLARAVIQAAQHQAGDAVEDVPSPSFTLVQTYQARDRCFWHCDLYRLGDIAELDELGLEEASNLAVLLIEWPDLARPLLGDRVLEVSIREDAADASLRHIHLSPKGPDWGHVTETLCGGVHA